MNIVKMHIVHYKSLYYDKNFKKQILKCSKEGKNTWSDLNEQ